LTFGIRFLAAVVVTAWKRLAAGRHGGVPKS
jgi:hypothetical protein